MTFRVLQTRADNDAARVEMVRRGISYWPRQTRRRVRDVARGEPAIQVGDPRKSWDVLATVGLLEEMKLHRELVVDLGAYASEVLCSLHAAGFSRLTGIDLNPRVRAMPFRRHVDWRVGDMMRTDLKSASVSAVLSISAIEHGFDEQRLLTEVSRVLRTGGLFVGSTDYWPAKLDTRGVQMLGMDWKIFSREEIGSFFERAGALGLQPMGSLDFSANEPAIECAGFRYTFGWFAFRRT